MKKFDIKDVFSWSNAEQAKAYINKSGYFADNLEDLQKCVNNDNFYILFSIDLDPKTDVDSIFSITEIDYKYALFIPADKVIKVEEKKYRPIETFEEFKVCTNKDIGDVIVFKEKNAESINTALVTGYHGSCLHKLGLGCICYSFQELFHNYLYLDSNNEWKFFGIEE